VTVALTVLTWLVTLAVATAGGLPVTLLVLRLAARSADSGPDAAVPTDAAEPPDPPPTDARQLRGGTWIGLLERAGVAAAVLAGYPTAAAFVIAVKGLGRYPELREHPEVSERFVIGTLASLLWAAAVGALGRLVLLQL